MSYQIEPGALADIASRVVTAPPGSGALITRVHELLYEAYRELIDPTPGRWVGSKAGGVLGKVRFLYFSPREYLVLFGSPTGTQGFSGRYKHVDIHKYLFAGRIDSYDLDSDDTEPLPPLMPGQGTCLARGHARGLTIHGVLAYRIRARGGGHHAAVRDGGHPTGVTRIRVGAQIECRIRQAGPLPPAAQAGADGRYLSMLPASTVTGRPVT